MQPSSTRSRIARAAAVAALVLAWAGAARSADGERVIVCLGDSLTEGYGLAPERAYPSLVERMLRESGHPVRVVNAGISGSTSASAVSRLRWQLRGRPDIVVIALGGNDGLRGIEVATTRANLSAAIELAKQSGARVLLAGMKLPPNYGPEYTAAFEAMFPALAKQHGVALLPFLLAGVAADPALNLPDGIHPNERGAEIVARNVLEALLPLLREGTAENRR
jgi:acyl-CoA thioesterase-1